jgi:hypothetical protein
MENQISEVKRFRKDLDSILQRMKAMPGSRENSLSITKLQEAIMWQGMVLKQIGEPNPYAQSYDPNSDKIEPTADGLKL